jgi:hypothetical protein
MSIVPRSNNTSNSSIKDPMIPPISATQTTLSGFLVAAKSFLRIGAQDLPVGRAGLAS